MRTETRNQRRCCNLVLLLCNVVLMSAAVTTFVYLAWTFSVRGHVTDVTDTRDGFQYTHNTNGVQSAQVQHINTTLEKEEAKKHGQLDFNTVDKMTISQAMDSKSGPRNPNAIKTERPETVSTEKPLKSKKKNIISKRGRTNIYGKHTRKGQYKDSEEVASNNSRGDRGSSDSSEQQANSNNMQKVGRTSWGNWAPCSVECGLGQQERVRSCGQHCQEIESKPCLIRPCEGAGMTDKWAYHQMFDLTDTDAASVSGDACEMWMKCSNASIQHYLSNIARLPSCPCFYPISLAIDQLVYDADQKTSFAWEDASGPAEHNHVYKPGAKFCIRSRLPDKSVTLAAQHCCYDEQLRLITRGRDAGTPNLVSPQLSRELHKKVDLLPWIICKGDWTRYNMIVQPNNHRQCSENPCLGEVKHQAHLATSY